MTGRRSGDGGQSSVELALVLPVVALVGLLIVQVAVVAHRHVLVVHTAREAARAAAVTDDDPVAAAERAARQASGLDPARLGVDTRLVGNDVEVSVTYREPTDVAMAGRFLPALTLTAHATMRRESVS